MATKAFEIGERVVLRQKRRWVGARVTQVDRWRRRVITDMGERKIVSARALWYPTESFLMLETRLDRKLSSMRNQGNFIREHLAAYGARLLYERVHSKEDLRRFLQTEGRRSSVRMIHFTGHGHGKAGTISLTFEEVKLAENLDLFKGLKGKVILFSSCEIGNLREVMRTLVRKAQLAGVIAYRTEVNDTYANLADAMIYDRLLLSSDPPRKIVQRVNKALRALDKSDYQSKWRGPVLTCYD
ncbi:MAG: hypothetical protein KIS92_14980 [Planctomycetota bacterium]|nr:hypothetical protein [Planctomycetota bacterium]